MIDLIDYLKNVWFMLRLKRLRCGRNYCREQPHNCDLGTCQKYPSPRN